MKSLNQIGDIKGKRIFLRVDFNVPIKEGKILDDTRIKETIPTIKFLIERGGKIILASHLGRPKGKRSPEFSLQPVVKKLKRLLKEKVRFTEELHGENVIKIINEMKEGEVLLIENTRFEENEEKDDIELAKKWRELADIYVNEAFAASHRKHTSVYTLPKLFEEKYAGFLLEKEINNLKKITENPEKPFIAILGGAKVEDKIGVIKTLIDKCDKILIGGGMMFTFWKAKGKSIGKSILDEKFIDEVKKLPEEKLVVAVDTRYSDSPESKKYTEGEEVPEGYAGYDIGERSIQIFKEEISKGKTIFWNGPMGVFENRTFAKGTYEVAKKIAEVTLKGAFSLCGGGETVTVIKKQKLENKISFVSTGGGASLEFIEKGSLPGIEALH
ncbi:MAG: phosphoglycerate kinase [Candidatus Hydrothermales bacterium]